MSRIGSIHPSESHNTCQSTMDPVGADDHSTPGALLSQVIINHGSKIWTYVDEIRARIYDFT